MRPYEKRRSKKTKESMEEYKRKARIYLILSLATLLVFILLIILNQYLISTGIVGKTDLQTELIFIGLMAVDAIFSTRFWGKFFNSRALFRKAERNLKG